MPPKRTAAKAKLTKEEKQQMNLDSKLEKLSPDDIEVKDEQEAALYLMHDLIILDIDYRRKNNLPDLLEKDVIDELHETLSTTVPGESRKTVEQYGYLYNIKLVASMKTKELEIKNGKKCRSCGKMTASMRNVQLRAGDEGTGRVLQCTNTKCKAVRKLDSG